MRQNPFINNQKISKKIFREKFFTSEILLLLPFIFFSIFILTLIDAFQYPILHSDLSEYHTALTQSILYHDYLSPYYNNDVMFEFNKTYVDVKHPIAYPQGWHVLTSSYSKFFGLNSMQMGFVLSGISISLIFGTIISLTRILSKSILYSFVAVSAFFYTAHGFSEYSLYGIFLSGIGPFLLGVIGLILFLTFLFSFQNKKLNYSILAALFFGIGVTYPILIIYVILISVVFLISNKQIGFYNNFKSHIKRFVSKKITVTEFVLIITIIGIFSGTHLLTWNTLWGNLDDANLSSNLDNNADYFSGFSRSTFFNEPLLIFTIILFVILMLNIFYLKENRHFSLLTFSLFIPILFVSYYDVSALLFTPNRLSVLIIPFSWLMLSITLASIDRRMSKISSNSNYILNFKIIKLNLNYSYFNWFFNYKIPALIFFGVSLLIFLEHSILIFDLNSDLYGDFTKNPNDVVCEGLRLNCK